MNKGQLIIRILHEDLEYELHDAAAIAYLLTEDIDSLSNITENNIKKVATSAGKLGNLLLDLEHEINEAI